MKKLFTILLLSFSSALFCYPTHPPEVSKPLQRLCQLKEGRELLAQVEAQGPLFIKTSHFGRNISNAAWIVSERTIYLNVANPRTLGSLICSIIFELHNALSDSQFDYYDKLAQEGRLSREEYIEAIEYIEYLNAWKTAHILDRGIDQGIFPTDARWPMAPSFAHHFHIQKISGHSTQIGAMYDQLTRDQRWLFQNKNKMS